MVITRQNLTLLLNMDLELEQTAAIQYIHHASTLTGIVYRHIAGMLKIFAFRKLKHAMILTEMIHELGGHPSPRMGTIHLAEDNEQILWLDLDDEQDAIRRYKTRIEQAEQLRETNLAKRLWAILRMEQQHAKYIQKHILSGITPEYEAPFRVMDVGSLSQTWAEKAANVPLRIKRQNATDST
ncbi:ferritin-like domain-containing protein [Anaerohalosphaeraceae bacterium U12dextr]